MAARRCPAPKCPTLIHGTTRYCTTHQREYEGRRGTSAARGYGADHQRLRRAWQARINAVPTPCTRCGHPIIPGQPWDLGHNDTDRTKHSGPEHSSCNRSAGGQQGRASQT